MGERWDRNVHYYEYTTDDAPSLRPEMDGLVVAEAYIYAEAGNAAVGIVLAVSSQDLHSGVALSEAIRMACERLAQLVEHHKQEARELKESRTYLYNWNGDFIRRSL